MINKLIFALAGILLGTASWASDLLSSTTLNQQAPDRYTVWELILSNQDKPWFAYYGADNRLYVRRPDGKEINFGATGRASEQSGLAMTSSGENSVAVLWRDKQPQKTLFLIPKLEATGDVPAPIVVGGAESEPLTALEIAHDQQEIYLLWLGEKGIEKPKPDSKPVAEVAKDESTKPAAAKSTTDAAKNDEDAKPEIAANPAKDDAGEQYHMYFRSVSADGKTLSPVEQVLPGLYPAWVVDEKAIPVFSWVNEDKPAIVMRVFDREKKTFAPLVKIADGPKVINSLFQAFKSGKRWFVIWLGQHDDDKNLLEGLYSDDQGKTWTRFAFDALRGLNQGHINIATDQQKHILIALDGNWRLTNPNDGIKNNIYILRSADNGTTWEKPQTVRPDEYRPTTAQYPIVAIGKQPGTVMLAWEDWRDIRQNVYVSYSRDYGATWEAALPLARPGVWNLGLNPLSRSLLADADGRFNLVANQYDDTSGKSEQDLVLYRFTWEELQRSAASFPAATQNTEARLRERMSKYWQAMIDRNYDVSYAFMDPFFRDARTLADYKSMVGFVQYHSYAFDRMAQKGNLAKVALTIEGEVPEFKTPSGKKITQPRKPISFVDTWVFVNNDWYREFYDGVGEISYTRY